MGGFLDWPSYTRIGQATQGLTDLRRLCLLTRIGQLVFKLHTSMQIPCQLFFSLSAFHRLCVRNKFSYRP